MPPHRRPLSFVLSLGLFGAVNRPLFFCIKELPWVQYFDSSRPQHLPTGHYQYPFFSFTLAATAIYPTRGDLHTHSYGLMSSLYASPGPTVTLVNIAHRNERPSVKFKIPCGKSNILNSAVVNTAGQSLYIISSTSKRTTFVACKNNVEVAAVQWDRSSPRMVFRQKKMKCKEWLPLAGPRTKYTPLLLLLLSF